jgi:site-specific DNA-cytosine methylase
VLGGRESEQGTLLTRHTVDWGEYAPAIERWERLFRPAPAPVDERGRLSPRFVEWMMGCPDGWVDVGTSRNAQLRVLGNSVQVQVAEAVGWWLADLMRQEAAA